MSANIETDRNLKKIILVLESIKKSLVRIGICAVLFSIGGYFLAEPILLYIKGLTGVRLAAYGVPEAFFAVLAVSLGFGIFVTVPLIFHTILAALPPIFPSFSRKLRFTFWVASVLLFYLGAFFSLRVSLPYGARFLIGLQTPEVMAIISVMNFVSFSALLIFGFGIIFQIPLAMMLLGRMGLVRVAALSRYRRYAVLGSATVAAVLTPTPDAVNMMLMAVPLYLLFEIGIIGMRLWKK